MGVIGDQLLGLIGKLHEIEQFGGSLGRGHAVQSVHAAREVQELGSSEPSEERHAFGDDADLPLHLHRMRRQIESENFNSSCAGRKQTGEHFDGG